MESLLPSNSISMFSTTESISKEFNILDPISSFVTKAMAVQDVPYGMKDGVNYMNDNTVVLVLVAPNKGNVSVTGTFNNWANWDMNKSQDGNRFWIELSNLNSGQEYIYQFIIDGYLRIADPMSEMVVDPWNDQYISSSIYPNLISYNDTDKGIASVFQPGHSYNWQVDNFKGVPKNELVVYELLIREFTDAKSYQSVVDSMQYLKKLGINAIELMPVNEFEGNSSWGYNPTFYMAVDKAYGHRDNLKKLVDAAHQNGIAVIIDMVYNHSKDQNPMVQMYFDSNINKTSWDNPWFNQDPPMDCYGAASWGRDFDHESQFTKDFFDRVNSYWMTEYKVDGFRLDFTKGFTNVQDGNCGWDYDQSRINILTRMANKIWEVNPSAYMILEHLASDPEEDKLAEAGILLWRRVDSDYKEAISGNELESSSFARAQSDTHIAFMESHDEERIMVQNLRYGATNGSYDIKSLPTALDRIELGAAFLYTVPGPKMIWMFGEQGFDYSINHCPSDPYGTWYDEGGCRVDPKPIVWDDYMKDQNRKDVYSTISDLLNLRKDYDAFTKGFFEWDNVGQTRYIKITHNSMNIVIIGNFGTTTSSVNMSIVDGGKWYNFFDQSEYDNVGENYILAPGQWELFTSNYIPPFDDNNNSIATPSNLLATVSVSNINLSWNDNANNEIAYQVEKSTDGNNFSVIASIDANSTSFSDTNLNDGKYYYKVKATGNNNSSSDYSNISNARIGEVTGLDIYFHDQSNWGNVNVHYWNSVPDVLPTSTWPGPNMISEGDGWYKYTLEGVSSADLLFSNAGSDKTADMSRDKNGWYENGSWSDVDPRIPVDNAPIVSISPEGGSFIDGDTVPVIISATDDNDIPVIYYTIDGSTPSSSSIVYNGSFDVTSSTTINAIAYDSKDQGSSVSANIYTFSTQGGGLTVHFKNSSNWNSVNVHYWNEIPNVLPASTWPGPIMLSEGDGWYSYTFNGVTSANLLFSNFGSDQTSDSFRDKDGWYKDGTWYDSKPLTPTGLIIHFKKPTDWSSAHIHYWNTVPTSASSVWPGEQMTSDGNDWYSFTIEEATSSSFLFNDNGASQTSDLFRDSEGWYDNGWSVSSGKKLSLGDNDNISTTLYQNYPNPVVNGATSIRFDLANDSNIKIEIFDISGRFVSMPVDGKYSRGSHKVILQTSQFNSGSYFIKLKSSSNTFTKQFIVK